MRAYLAPSAVGGAVDCLDPDSRRVSRALLDPPELDARLDARALAADVAEFRRILLRQYAGAPELLQSPTFDVDAFFQAWHDDLLAGPTEVSLREGVAERVVAIQVAVGDRHLGLFGQHRFFSEHPDLRVGEFHAVELSPPVDPSRCRARPGPPRPLEGTLREATEIGVGGARGHRLVVSARGPGDMLTMTCGSAAVSFARRAPAAVTPSLPVYEWAAEGDAAILRIGRLHGSKAELAQLERLAHDAPEHAKMPTIVVDLRGNGGGSDRYAYEWVGRMARGRVETAWSVTGASSLPCGGWNALVADQLGSGSATSDDARAERERYLERMRTTPLPSGPRVRPGTLTFDAPKPYGGRVFVLVDRRTASSAEGTALLLAASLGATILGERSGGYFEYGEVTPFLMPRTGVVWNVPTKRFYASQRVESVGIPVDAYLSAEALALDARSLLPWLRALPSRDALRRHP